MKLVQVLSMFSLLAALSACKTEPDKAPDDIVTTDSTGGYTQKIYAIGYHFVGEPAKDWRLYETYSFDSAGREVEKIVHWDAGGTQLRTSYDAQGRKVKVVRTATDRVGNVDYNTTWSEGGRKSVEEEYIHRESKTVLRTTSLWDSAGKELERIVENLQFPEYGIDSQRTTFSYDPAGRLVLEQIHFQGKTIPNVRYTYDARGFQVQLDRFDAEGKVSRSEFIEHDTLGRMLRLYAQEASDAERKLEKSYKWDSAGHMLEEHHYSGICTAKGEQSGQCRIVESVRCSYDSAGRPLTKDTFKEGKAEASMRLKYEYHPFAR